MPTNPTYPGVYIEEVPSAVRAIVGVSTSRTAFIGRARWGPENDPTNIKNFGDFERKFGGLWEDSTMSYAVRQYFQNGGSDAVIVRLTKDGVASKGQMYTQASSVTFNAVTAGAAGNKIRINVRPSSNPATANDRDRFDIDIIGKDSNGNDDKIAKTNTTLSALKGELDPPAAANYVTIDESQVDINTNLTADGLQPTSYVLSGGADAVHARREIKDSNGVTTIIIEALTAGNDGNDIQVEITNVANDDTFTFMADDNQGTSGTLNNVKVEDLATAIAGHSDLPNIIRVASDSPPPGDPPAELALSNLEDGADAVAATATAYTRNADAATSFYLEAANSGTWGDALVATVDHDVREGDLPNDDQDDRFNLLIEEVDEDGKVVRFELHRNLSVNPASPRRFDTVLEDESDMIRYNDNTLPASRPLPIPNTEFENGDDGTTLTDTEYLGSQSKKTGIYALENEDLFNLLVIPPPEIPAPGEHSNTSIPVWSAAMAYCQKRRAVLLVDAPSTWDDKEEAVDGIKNGFSSLRSNDAALYFPQVRMADPLKESRLQAFAPSGVIAGVIARTDASRGFWKAPAGIEATMVGVRELAVPLTDAEQGDLNPLGINCLRAFPVPGRIVWGSRTTNGADQLASQWKYLPVRRTALYIEESLYRGTQWVVFEPNDEPLWSQIRLNVGAFMHDLFRKGAFQGSSPKEAYFVKCDKETTTQDDIDKGIVNILVGFAPLKPAEFVIIKISQITNKDQ